MCINIRICVYNGENGMKNKINKILEILNMIWELINKWAYIILPIIIIIELIFALIAGFINYSNL